MRVATALYGLMLSVLAVITIAGLAGCGEPDPTSINQIDFDLKIRLVDEVRYNDAIVSGLSEWGEGWCIVTLPVDEYPRCLQHEIRHCIEGDFHAGHKSYEDCTE